MTGHGDDAAERLLDGIDALGEIREPGEPGWTRRALTGAALVGRAEVVRRMRAAGLDCWVDGAGNAVGLLAGRGGHGPALVTGSHTDTVLGGGKYDGIAGVLGAIEAVEALRRAGRRLEHDLLVVDFYGEEANDFGLSCLGSRALAGTLTTGHLDRTDATGNTLGAALRTAGIDPHAALGCRWRAGDVKAVVELHVEQGPVLEEAGCPVGIVTAIAAIARADLVFHGRRDHAGTMPVALRHDAACAAAEAILAVERLGRDGGVATVGQMTLQPGAVNVVPDRARLTVEFRSTDPEWLGGRRTAFAVQAREAARCRGVGVEIEWISGEPATTMSADVCGAIAGAAAAAGHRTMTLPSGAGHDSVQMARLASTGMIFVPSRDGRSHCPEEFTEAGDIACGVDVLARTLVALDSD